MTTAYSNLKKRRKEISNLSKAVELLSWDRDADIMQAGSSDERGEILAQLSIEILRKEGDAQMGEWLSAAAAEKLNDPWDQRNLVLMREKYTLSRALPEKLVSDLTNAVNECNTIYSTAKEENDWNAVKGPMANILRLTKEQAKIYGDVLECAPYDALLAQHSRGNSVALIDPLFSELKKEIIPLMIQIQDKQKNTKADFDFSMDCDADIKQKFIRNLAEKAGFSFNRGRVDTSVHPFSGGTKYDTRITYGRTESVTKTIHSVLHECGHARYSQNAPDAWDGQPVGDTGDMVLQESQSLTVEKQMAYSAEFLAHIYEELMGVAPEMKKAGSLESFINSFHKVTPSFIRFSADEVTYPLHVMHRYDIEKMLFDDAITVDDLPSVWNEKFEKDFGLNVPEHKLGCMQDVHWFSGMYGYFPTYTQGALYAAQFYAAAKREITNPSDLLRRGHLVPAIDWMAKNVHQYGQRFDAPDLIARATGEKPSTRFFIEHLKARYLA